MLFLVNSKSSYNTEQMLFEGQINIHINYILNKYT